MELQSHKPTWKNAFDNEAELLRRTLGSQIIDIHHIGSTAIPIIEAKPIIDVMILVNPMEQEEQLIALLKSIEYVYFHESSSTERMFFRKGDPVQYHLSITEKGRTTYWQRQILFRDYLNAHPDKAKEYEQLKHELIVKDPSAGQTYSEGKNEFIQMILNFAEVERPINKF